MSDEMQDDDFFIGYCDIHCETPRALFNAEQINRMAELAGKKGRVEEGWYSMHSDMKALVKLAEERRKKPVLTIVK